MVHPVLAAPQNLRAKRLGQAVGRLATLVAGSEGKFILIMSCSRRTSSTPLRVANEILSSQSTRPTSQSANAVAKVACPHRSTSATGVNQRSPYPSPLGQVNAVSERFISAAICCIQSAGGSTSGRQTAAGLPVNGSSAKASICKMGIPAWFSMPRYDCRCWRAGKSFCKLVSGRRSRHGLPPRRRNDGGI